MEDSEQPEPPPEIENLNALLSQLNDETDRGACLVGASYIDEKLKEIISAFTIDVFDSDDSAVALPLLYPHFHPGHRLPIL